MAPACSVDSATPTQGYEFNPLDGCRHCLKIESQKVGQKGKGISTPSYAEIKYTWVLRTQNWYPREFKKCNWYILKEREDMTIETLSNFITQFVFSFHTVGKKIYHKGCLAASVGRAQDS